MGAVQMGAVGTVADGHCSTVQMGAVGTVADRYCSTVQDLLDWFEVDSGFAELLFIHSSD